ncbi:MAG: energy-coupling factor transporter transmembrane protein EcfT [Acholeplasmatales bacterium]|nr:energy-coupling factor transporter transmembrane protein EcfT [Acholeplasmatales bacterium]
MNITFGQYVPGNSWIYKLDPRVKILLSITLIVIIFLIPTLYGMLIALGTFVLIFLTTRISLFKVLKSIKGILFLLLFTVLLQMIYTKGTASTLYYSFDMSIGLYQILIMIGLLAFYYLTKKYIPFKFLYLLFILFLCFMTLWNSPFHLFDWNFNVIITDFKFDVYKEGVDKSLFIFIRIVMMVGITSLLTLSTMSIDINNGIESILSPLKIFKIPVGVFSMLISLTLRFIPTLLIESRKIMNAQASRGADFNEGHLHEKVKQIVALLIPMFVVSFKRADDLANAMEARGYVIGEPRTKLDELKIRWRDWVSIIIVLAFLGLVIWSMIYYV